MQTRHSVHVAVYAYLIKDDKILLNLRKNTGWMDGYLEFYKGKIFFSEFI